MRYYIANLVVLATIYPNPSLDYFVLDFSTLSIKEEITPFILLNLLG